jgi:hypothetical protein
MYNQQRFLLGPAAVGSLLETSSVLWARCFASLCSAFTCGSAFQVLTSQVQHVLGLSLPNYLGPGTLVKIYIGIGMQNTHQCISSTDRICIVRNCMLNVDELFALLKWYRPGTLVKIYIGIGMQQNTHIHALAVQTWFALYVNVCWRAFCVAKMSRYRPGTSVKIYGTSA